MRPRAVEIEWQLAVRDLAAVRRWLVTSRFAGWSVEPAGVVQIRDGYYDTADWRAWRSGYALRLRRSGATIEATLKALRRARSGMARRREVLSRLADARPRTLLRGRGRVPALARSIVADAHLRRLFGVRTRRESFVVRRNGHAVAELVLDQTRIVAAGRERRLARVEVEVTKGPPALVGRFVATLRRRRHLSFTRRSKFEEGLATAGLEPGG